MPKTVGTTTNDGEGLTATFTVGETATDTLTFDGRIDSRDLEACNRNFSRRLQCESFLSALYAVVSAVERSHKHNQHASDNEKVPGSCTLLLEFKFNDQVARLKTPLKFQS